LRRLSFEGLIYRDGGPSTRKFLYGDRAIFRALGQYHAHEGHVGVVIKTRIFKGPGTRHNIRYGTECECGATLWPIAPDMELVDRPLDTPDLSETTWTARARYLLRTMGVPEQGSVTLASQIDALTSQLSTREAEIILDRFGLTELDPSDRRTLQQIASRLGVSRERVRQIESRAIRKLRSGI